MVHTQQDFYVGAIQSLKDGLVGGTQTIEGVHASVLDSLAMIGVKNTLNSFITKQVYYFLSGITRHFGGLAETLLRHLPLPGGDLPPTRSQLLMMSSINGAFGDWLHQQNRVWAIPMELCRDGSPLVLTPDTLRERVTAPSPHVIVLAHGLCLNDLHWQPLDQPGFGERWEKHHGATVLSLRYNTGMHIHENGRQLALLLQQLVQSYPIPIERLSLIGHSMGGLVSRSACSYAKELELSWLSVLQDVACLGSPHRGAGLERIGQWVTLTLGKLPITASLGRAGQQRSAGIKDLRYACLRHEDWSDSHPDADKPLHTMPLPLLPEVRYCLLATNWKPGLAESLGDGLVQVSSAQAFHLGGHELEIPQVQRPLLQGLHHMELPRHPQVYNVLTKWLFDIEETTALLQTETPDQ